MFSVPTLTDADDTHCLLPELEERAKVERLDIFHLVLDINILSVECAHRLSENAVVSLERRQFSVSSGRFICSETRPSARCPARPEKMQMRISYAFQPSESRVLAQADHSLIDEIAPVLVWFTIRESTPKKTLIDCKAIDLLSLVKAYTNSPDTPRQEIELELGGVVTLECKVSTNLPLGGSNVLSKSKKAVGSDSGHSNMLRTGKKDLALAIHSGVLRSQRGLGAQLDRGETEDSLDSFRGVSNEIETTNETDPALHSVDVKLSSLFRDEKDDNYLSHKTDCVNASLEERRDQKIIPCTGQDSKIFGTSSLLETMKSLHEENHNEAFRPLAFSHPFHALTSSRVQLSTLYHTVCDFEEEGATLGERPIVSEIECPKPITIWSIGGPLEESDEDFAALEDEEEVSKKRVEKLRVLAHMSPTKAGPSALPGILSPLQSTYIAPKHQRLPDYIPLVLQPSSHYNSRFTALRQHEENDEDMHTIEEPDEEALEYDFQAGWWASSSSENEESDEMDDNEAAYVPSTAKADRFSHTMTLDPRLQAIVSPESSIFRTTQMIDVASNVEGEVDSKLDTDVAGARSSDLPLVPSLENAQSLAPHKLHRSDDKNCTDSGADAALHFIRNETKKAEVEYGKLFAEYEGGTHDQEALREKNTRLASAVNSLEAELDSEKKSILELKTCKKDVTEARRINQELQDQIDECRGKYSQRRFRHKVSRS